MNHVCFLLLVYFNVFQLVQNEDMSNLNMLDNLEIDPLLQAMESKFHKLFNVESLLKTMQERHIFSSLRGNTSGFSQSCKSFLMEPFNYLVAKDTQGLMKWVVDNHIVYYLDATGTVPDRILLGNTGWYGAYDECATIPGAHYCIADMVLLNQPQLLSGYYGICAPKNFSGGDLYLILKLINFVNKGKVINFPATGSLSGIGGPVLCNDKEPHSSDTVAFIVLFSILLFLCVIGTITEGLQDCLTPKGLIPKTVLIDETDSLSDTTTQNGSVEYQRFGVNSFQMTRGNGFTNFLMCFSALKNCKSILSTDFQPGTISCLNGIRAISMTWVILGHVYFFAVYVKMDNISLASQITERFSYEAIANAYVSVDTFFLLSGLLVSYVALKKMDQSGGKISVVAFYLHRFIRLTPSYMLSIFIYTSLYPHIMKSPLGLITKHSGNVNCKKYWWTNLLYINNFYPWQFMSECLGWSWYLANDMQFYIISPLFLFLMYKFKLRGAIISTSFTVLVCTVITGAIIGANDYPSLITEAFSPKGRSDPVYQKKVGDFSSDVYVKPYTRITPYVIGLLLGYIFSRKIHVTGKPKLVTSLFGWIIATGLGMSVIYGPYTVFMKNGDLLNATENIFYGAFSRFAWSLALAWVVYACHNKMGGIINSFLSWRAWIPLSRLTYGAYLLHPIVLSYYYNSLQNPLHFQDNTTIFRFLSVLVVSYSLAFAMALLVDIPVFNLEKMVTKMLSKPKGAD